MHHQLDLKIYQIKKFGYYSRLRAVPDIDDAVDLLGNLKSWISRLDIVDNCTYASTKAAGSEKTLCVSVTKNPKNDDFFLTMWAGVDVSDENAVGAIKPGATPDDVKVEHHSFSRNAVPGYPIYFYVMPEHGVLAPVKFDGSANGIINFNRYITGFLERFSKYCHYTTEPGKRTLEFHGRAGEAENRYHPRFAYRTWQKKDIEAFLLERCADIKRIIKSDMILGTRDRSFLTRIFNLDRDGDATRLDGVKFKYELDAAPTKKELKDMIAQKNAASLESDLDYGFKIGGDIYWLGHAIQKHRFSADIRRSGGILFSASGTMAFLQSVRRKIIEDLHAGQEADDEDEG